VDLPELFDFTQEEIKTNPDIMNKLIPNWYQEGVPRSNSSSA